MRTLAAILLLSLAFTGTAIGKERAEVCAKNRNADGWSKPYKVVAVLQSGSELNQAVGGFNYSSYDTYVVIFWDQNQVSVIHMDSPYFDYTEVDGYDQEGRAWKVKKGSFCY